MREPLPVESAPQIPDQPLPDLSERPGGSQLEPSLALGLKRARDLIGVDTPTGWVATLAGAALETGRADDSARWIEPLTGVANRGRMMEALGERIRGAAGRKGFGLALVDLDRFHLVNRERGYLYGDRLLKELAGRILHLCRESEEVGRIGDDQFLIVSDSGAGAARFSAFLERLTRALAIDLPEGAQPVQLTATVGAVCHPEDGDDVETLLRRAELAMRAAKREGGNRFRFFDAAMEAEILSRQALLDEIPAALAADQFVLFYQPIIAMDTGETVGAEALLRWHHPEKGLCSAGQFIPIIERHAQALVRPLGRWVLEEAARQLARWQMLGMDIDLHVNVSADYFLHGAFMRDLDRAISSCPGMEVEGLVLELTETSLLADIDRAAGIMRECRAMGVRMALDDFGTGYASLTYLKRLPIDVVKIDQSFVKDLGNQTHDRAIVRGIVAMARALNLSVVAEGVEQESQVRQLLELGCLQMQGFGLARPMAGERLERRIGGIAGKWEPLRERSAGAHREAGVEQAP